MNSNIVWKQQAKELPDFPLLKENEAGSNYTIGQAPAPGETVCCAFSRNHKDAVLREVFSDIRFNQAISLGLDRNEINEITHLRKGRPQQAMPAEARTVGFVTEEHLTNHITFDTNRANALLEEAGLTDSNGDGARERPDSQPLTVRILFASQGLPSQLHELVSGYWTDPGLRVGVSEVSSDEYRAADNNNDVDLHVWKNDGTSGPFILQDRTMLVPPFGDVFNPGGGFEWAAWKASNGAEGIEPPEDIKELWELAEAFIQEPLGSEESSRLGKEIIDIHVDNLLKFGIVGDVPSPNVYRNDLKKLQALMAKTFDFYRVHPYRPQQWVVATDRLSKPGRGIPPRPVSQSGQRERCQRIRDLQRDIGMSMIFVTHDLGVIAQIADDIAVMYLGTIVEYGSVHDVLRDPKHPYTRGLMDAILGRMQMVFREGGLPLHTLGGEALRRFRPHMSLVFQDPYSSLNPRMTVRDIIAEPLVAGDLMHDRDQIDARVREIAARCKLNLEHLRRFPHAFSGGQRQRICIARALVPKPDFVVCDESVSALDVSIQAEIVNLLKDLQDEMGVAFLFIAPVLPVVAQMSHRVAVMYVGKFVEYAPTESLFFAPRHPYTNALLSAVPRTNPDASFGPIRLDGEIPNPASAPSGCRFHTRCPDAEPRCAAEGPAWREIAPEHWVACHFAEAFDFSRPRAATAE